MATPRSYDSRIGIRLPAEARWALEMEAARRGQTFSHFVRQVLIDAVRFCADPRLAARMAELMPGDDSYEGRR